MIHNSILIVFASIILFDSFICSPFSTNDKESSTSSLFKRMNNPDQRKSPSLSDDGILTVIPHSQTFSGRSDETFFNAVDVINDIKEYSKESWNEAIWNIINDPRLLSLIVSKDAEDVSEQLGNFFADPENQMEVPSEDLSRVALSYLLNSNRWHFLDHLLDANVVEWMPLNDMIEIIRASIFRKYSQYGQKLYLALPHQKYIIGRLLAPNDINPNFEDSEQFPRISMNSDKELSAILNTDFVIDSLAPDNIQFIVDQLISMSNNPRFKGVLPYFLQNKKLQEKMDSDLIFHIAQKLEMYQKWDVFSCFFSFKTICQRIDDSPHWTFLFSKFANHIQNGDVHLPERLISSVVSELALVGFTEPAQKFYSQLLLSDIHPQTLRSFLPDIAVTILGAARHPSLQSEKLLDFLLLYRLPFEFLTVVNQKQVLYTKETPIVVILDPEILSSILSAFAERNNVARFRLILNLQSKDKKYLVNSHNVGFAFYRAFIHGSDKIVRLCLNLNLNENAPSMEYVRRAFVHGVDHNDLKGLSSFFSSKSYVFKINDINKQSSILINKIKEVLTTGKPSYTYGNDLSPPSKEDAKILAAKIFGLASKKKQRTILSLILQPEIVSYIYSQIIENGNARMFNVFEDTLREYKFDTRKIEVLDEGLMSLAEPNYKGDAKLMLKTIYNSLYFSRIPKETWKLFIKKLEDNHLQDLLHVLPMEHPATIPKDVKDTLTLHGLKPPLL